MSMNEASYVCTLHGTFEDGYEIDVEGDFPTECMDQFEELTYLHGDLINYENVSDYF